ncbi:MAG TPA: hypothetical protein VGN76_11925 [Gemmatimonadales bacterium]|jgi:hypothetical protein|nr:hypothetical protein [Gemmatimonadales bacterium]
MIHRELLVATGLIAFAAGSNTTAPNQPISEGVGASSESRSFHLTKECSEYLGQAGNHCTVIKSNVQLIPAGATVTYLVAADLVHGTYDGDVVLRANPGDAASGHCIVTDLVKAIGNCAFSGGTGHLSGFHAIVVVSGDRNPLLAHWKGRFSLNP